jgi:hypothetical protein
MPANIIVMGMRSVAEANNIATAHNGVVVNTTSKAKNNWQTDLSPFHLGPCPLYDGYTAAVMENAWQYAKVYKQHTDSSGDPTEAYWNWAKQGWTSTVPVRYPMGRGARPEYSLWKGEHLGYIDARKRIYAPLYAEAVQKTKGWQRLVQLYHERDTIILRDYDGYRHDKDNMSLSDVLNEPRKIMGHAFVLKMLLTDDMESLDQLELRTHNMGVTE